MSLPASATPSQDQALSKFGQLPLQFEANQGQLDPSVKFLSRGAGYSLLLTAQGPEIQLLYADSADPSAARNGMPALRSAVVKTRLVGASQAPAIAGEDRATGASHYLTGASTQWHTDVARYGRVRYQAVYPGVDLVYHGDQQQLEYDFVVAPHADASRIALRFEGAEAPRLDAQGNLVLKTQGGDLVQHAPVIYQDIGGQRVPVQGHYRIDGEQVAFSLGTYDPAHALVIDPLLGYKLYVPGVSVLQARTMALADDGSVYIAGYAPAAPWAANLPLARQVLTYDAFVAKLNPAGNALQFTTFIGGSQNDEITAMALADDGSIVVAGYTMSNELPMRSPLQGTKGGYADGWVARLDAAGKSLIYSTYLGGNSHDAINALALDAAGNIVAGGYTSSENFPTQGALGPDYHGGYQDAFVAKISANGSTLMYSAFLGGSDFEDVRGVAVDAAGNVYVTGATESLDFPLLNAFQSSITPYVSGTYTNYYTEGFVAKINAAGSALVYSTYLGGTYTELPQAIAVDAAGSAYVTGVTESQNFPVKSALRPTSRGGSDVFITKFSPTGDSLVFSTYLGGSGFDAASDIKLDADGSVVVAGYTNSTNFPTRAALQSYTGGSQDVFVSRLSADGAALLYSTFFGAGGNEAAVKLALGSDGSIYLAGNTTSRNFPVKGPVQGASFGAGDAFASKIAPTGQALAYSTYLGETNLYVNYGLLGYTGTAPEDRSLNIAVPLRGLIGCSLRALPTDVVGDLSVIYRTRIPCGTLAPPP